MWNKIQKQLNKKHITLYQLAKKANIHYDYFMQLKFGRIKKPSFEKVCQIADALGVNLSYFRTNKKEE